MRHLTMQPLSGCFGKREQRNEPRTRCLQDRMRHEGARKSEAEPPGQCPSLPPLPRVAGNGGVPGEGERLRDASMDSGGFADIANAKPIFASKLFFSGGLNRKELYGDFAAAWPSVDRALRIGMPGGGYIFRTTNVAFKGLPLDRYLLILKMREQYGRYA
jgi:hypothetical protein